MLPAKVFLAIIALMARIRAYSIGIVSLSLLLVLAYELFGQVKRDDFRRTLTEKAGLTAADFNRLAAGETVVSLIETNDKQEVAVVGAAMIKLVRPVTLADLRASLSQKRGGDGSRFSDPPRITDLADLRLTKDDVKVLRKCKVGDCDLNLSESAIRLITALAAASDNDRLEQQTKIFTQILLEHLLAYQADGDRSLGEYANRGRKVILSAAHEKLLRDALLLKEVAPELAAELGRYPQEPTGRVETEFFWNTFDFGLKPMLTVSHVASYPAGGSTPGPLVIATKQIYASRYLDASLTLAMIVAVGDSANSETYLVFTDRSRSDALEGMFGSFARRVVRNEAVKRVEEIVGQAKARLEDPDPQAESTPVPPEDGILSRAISWATNPTALAVVAAAALLLIFLLRPMGRQGK